MFLPLHLSASMSPDLQGCVKGTVLSHRALITACKEGLVVERFSQFEGLVRDGVIKEFVFELESPERYKLKVVFADETDLQFEGLRVLRNASGRYIPDIGTEEANKILLYAQGVKVA